MAAVEAKHGTCSGDLPPLDKLRESLRRADWTKFRSVDKELTPQDLFNLRERVKTEYICGFT